MVLACGGPSLNRVDPFEPGLPVVVISTAIRSPRLWKPKPMIWVLADPPNPNHGEKRKPLWEDPEVLKVVPNWQRFHGGRNVARVPCSTSAAQDKQLLKSGRGWMDGQLPLLRDTHKSLTLALGWLASVGVKEIIICGCDLSAGRRTDQKYAYDIRKGQRVFHSQLRALRACFVSLKDNFVPSAAERGIKLWNWSPGGRLGDLMENYRDECSDRTCEEEGGVPAPL